VAAARVRSRAGAAPDVSGRAPSAAALLLSLVVMMLGFLLPALAGGQSAAPADTTAATGAPARGAASDTESDTEAAPRTLLVFGDSLSAGFGLAPGEGWVDLLERRFVEHGRKVRVVNASVSGETTAGGRSRLARALRIHDPDVVILELGGNDGLRGTPIAVIRDNLSTMIETAQAAGATPILVGMRIPTNYGPDYAGDFAAMFPALAARHEVPLVPFLLEGVAMAPALMQADRIHPTAQAQGRVLENVWAVLARSLGHAVGK
jgi:acyl-CoA thioesterase-1